MVFQAFKNGVAKIREKVEEFKGRHKIASGAISHIIEGLPPPFNTFIGIVWEGIEKQDDSGEKLLAILEKIENSNEDSFAKIEQKISDLIQHGAKQEDLQKVGDQIRTSHESVIVILDDLRSKLAEKDHLTFGTIFDLAINATAFLSLNKGPSIDEGPTTALKQWVKDDLAILELNDIFSNDPIFGDQNTKESDTTAAEYVKSIENFRGRIARVLANKYGDIANRTFQSAGIITYLSMLAVQGIKEDPEVIKRLTQEFLEYLQYIAIPDRIVQYAENTLNRWTDDKCPAQDTFRSLQLFDWYLRRLGSKRSQPIIAELEKFLSGDILPCDNGFSEKADNLLNRLHQAFSYDIVR
jgi:hypothetical protein